MEYSVMDIARYVIAYCNEKSYAISNLKLQKILYFIQADFLVNSNGMHPCFNNRIEAWDFGPVIPEVYQEYKNFGASNIYCSSKSSLVEYSKKIRQDDKIRINTMIDVCSNYTAARLVEITHNQSPWIDNYIRYCNNRISNDSIYTFFRN